VARRMSVVPVSTMPAVVSRMRTDEPYRMDWSIPQYFLGGYVLVMGL
jgi:hypothetical protein